MRLAVASLRYRLGGTVVLFVLATLAVAAATFAPLYQRTVEAAGLQAVLAHADDTARGLALSITPAPDSAPVDPRDALRGLDRRFYETPLAARQLPVTYRVSGLSVQGPVVTRDAQCAHLVLVTGRCPTSSAEVAASASAARVLHLHVGTSLITTGTYPGAGAHALPVRVVGLYAPFPAADGYWFDHAYSSAAGAQVLHNANGPEVFQADALFVAPAFFDAFAAATDDGSSGSIPLPVTDSVEFRLRAARVGLDDEAALRRGIAATNAAAAPAGLITQTALPDLLSTAATGRDQAARIIPAFAVQIALLVAVALAIVVQAAVEDRRAQIALARLRGVSGPSVTRSVVGELMPVTVAGLVVGYAAALGATALAANRWLDGRAEPETRWAPVLAALAVLLAEMMLIALATLRAARQPVHDLLQGVRRPSSRRGATAVELIVAAAAAAGVVVTASGDRHTVLALATPALMALVAGLLLGRAAAAVAARTGRALFWRGRRAGALAALQFARRPGTRRIVAVVCVATAVAVAACNEDIVAADNRTARAGVTAGAPAVLITDSTDAGRLQRAVHRADPRGTAAAAVVTQTPPNGPAVLAADATALRTVAAWGWPGGAPAAAELARLSPALPAPVTLTGGTVQLSLSQVEVARAAYPLGGSRPGSAFLLLELVTGTGQPYGARLGPLPSAGTASATLRQSVPCASGCRLTGLQVLRTGADFDQLTFAADLALAAGIGGRVAPVPLGTAATWNSVDGPQQTSYAQPDTIALTAAGAGLRLVMVNAGTNAELRQLSMPDSAPALATTGADTSADASGRFQGTGIDGVAMPLTVAGRVPFLPGPARPELLVDLDYAMRVTGTSTVVGGTASVWLRDTTPALRHRVESALASAGIRVTGSDSAAARLADLTADPPAAAMRLAFVTAGFALLLAVLVQVLTGLATVRARRDDRTALTSIGMDDRSLTRGSVLEQVAAVLVGGLAGTAVGLAASAITLPGVPIFVEASGVPDTRRGIPVLVAAVTASAVLAVLVLVASVGAARSGGRRERQQRERRHAA